MQSTFTFSSCGVKVAEKKKASDDSDDDDSDEEEDSDEVLSISFFNELRIHSWSPFARTSDL